MKNTLQKLNGLVTRRNIAIVIIIASILLLIPILWAAFYTVPSADDFSYGMETINVLETKGIFAVFTGAIKNLISSYNEWQGTFSATFLFTLNPAIFGENFYCLTTFIILGVYFLSSAYLFRQVLTKFLKADKYIYLIVLFLFFMLCVETMIDKNQGLYWWNGASYYIIFFSLELFEIGLLIKKYFLKEKGKLDILILSILAFIIGGGNYIIALQQIIVLVFLNLYLIIKKKDKSALIYLIFAILGFGISAIAPGNKVRQEIVTGMSAIEAIFLSFSNSIIYMNEWINPLNVIVSILILVALYPTYKIINKKFSYPLIAVLFMYCILSAEFTPTLYSMSFAGPTRLLNIIYFTFLLFMIISGYYIIGYIRNKMIERKAISKNVDLLIAEFAKENAIVLLLSAIVILIIPAYLSRNRLTSYETYALIKNGEARTYKKEWDERYKVLKNDKIKKVEFERLTYYPYPIFCVEISSDPEGWLNYPVAKIYHKDYVIVKESEVD